MRNNALIRSIKTRASSLYLQYLCCPPLCCVNGTEVEQPNISFCSSYTSASLCEVVTVAKWLLCEQQLQKGVRWFSGLSNSGDQTFHSTWGTSCVLNPVAVLSKLEKFSPAEKRLTSSYCWSWTAAPSCSCSAPNISNKETKAGTSICVWIKHPLTREISDLLLSVDREIDCRNL